MNFVAEICKVIERSNPNLAPASIILKCCLILRKLRVPYRINNNVISQVEPNPHDNSDVVTGLVAHMKSLSFSQESIIENLIELNVSWECDSDGNIKSTNSEPAIIEPIPIEEASSPDFDSDVHVPVIEKVNRAVPSSVTLLQKRNPPISREQFIKNILDFNPPAKPTGWKSITPRNTFGRMGLESASNVLQIPITGQAANSVPTIPFNIGSSPNNNDEFEIPLPEFDDDNGLLSKKTVDITDVIDSAPLGRIEPTITNKRPLQSASRQYAKRITKPVVVFYMPWPRSPKKIDVESLPLVEIIRITGGAFSFRTNIGTNDSFSKIENDRKFTILYSDIKVDKISTNYPIIGILDSDEQIPEWMKAHELAIVLRFNYVTKKFTSISPDDEAKLKSIISGKK